jgi:F-type H+-transporting ATPase subunit delta
VSGLTVDLQRVVDAVAPKEATALEVLAVSDLISEYGLLGRRMTDPVLAETGRRALTAKLFTGKIAADALRVVQQSAAESHESGLALRTVLDDAAVRLLWRSAAGDSARVRSDLARLIVAVENSPELLTVIGEQSYPKHAREELISKLLGDAVSEVALTMAKLAVGRQTGGYVRVLQHYLDIGADLRASLRATVTTAIALNEPQLKQMIAELKRIYGTEIDPFLKIDRKVVGGVRVEIAGEVIDGSMATRMAKAKQVIEQQGILV